VCAGVTVTWVTGEAVYRRDGQFLRFVEANMQVTCWPCRRIGRCSMGSSARRVGVIADAFSPAEWVRADAGVGTLGPARHQPPLLVVQPEPLAIALQGRHRLAEATLYCGARVGTSVSRKWSATVSDGEAKV
jgi:hypothetical protein